MSQEQSSSLTGGLIPLTDDRYQPQGIDLKSIATPYYLAPIATAADDTKDTKDVTPIDTKDTKDVKQPKEREEKYSTTPYYLVPNATATAAADSKDVKQPKEREEKHLSIPPRQYRPFPYQTEKDFKDAPENKDKYFNVEMVKWYSAEKALFRHNQGESRDQDMNYYIRKFFMGPQPKAVEKEELELQEIRDKYGDFCVLLVKCGDDGNSTIAKVSPIEMALVPPFSFNLSESSEDDLKKYVKPPLLLPVQSPTNVVSTSNSLEKPGILVINATSVELLGDRRGFISNNFPVANYLESLFAPYKVERLNLVFESELKALQDAYLKTKAKIATPLSFDSSYTNEAKADYFNKGLKTLYANIATGSEDDKIDALNRIIATESQYKLVTPTMEESLFDWYAAQLLYNNMAEQYKEAGPALLYHPGLVEYAKVIMGNLVRLGAWKPQYFNRVVPVLEIESFRVASIPKTVNDPPVIVPKDYFTIFDEDQMQSLDIFSIGRLNPTIIKKRLNKFAGGVLDKLDFTKTCLTGSAIPIIFTKGIEGVFEDEKNPKQYFKVYSPIFTYGNDVELKGRTLDLAKGTILTPGSKVPEAIFDFGADVDLAILTEDNKEFDAIAIKHFGVYSTEYPNLELRKNNKVSGYSYQILSTNAYNYTQGFRNIEIYKGTIAKILSHHVPMTRGWYDGKLHLDVTAIKVYRKSEGKFGTQFDNYFYFASSKATPLEILEKYHQRRFIYSGLKGIDLPFYLSYIRGKRKRELAARFVRENIERQPIPNRKSAWYINIFAIHETKYGRERPWWYM